MHPVILYGKAVQDARNRLRSVQTSTMFEAMQPLLSSSGEEGQLPPLEIAKWINDIPVTKASKRALSHLQAAKTRAKEFSARGMIGDVFALGDALRELADFLNEGGDGDTWKEFLARFRDEAVFDKQSNRARIERPIETRQDYPELGIFRYWLLERSVVKYMERALGPYLGADISGSTPDALGALVYLLISNKTKSEEVKTPEAWTENLLKDGSPLVAVASMVLQYHHSLLECVLALALIGNAKKGKDKSEQLLSKDQSDYLLDIDLYRFSSLILRDDSTSWLRIKLENGDAALKQELGGARLLVVRDFIDIEHNPYADCEIALLVPPGGEADALFQPARSYERFSKLRQNQCIDAAVGYRRSDPNLYQVANEFKISTDPNLMELVKQNSNDLRQMKEKKPVFDNLDEAVGTIALRYGNDMGLLTANDTQAASVQPGAQEDAQLAEKAQLAQFMRSNSLDPGKLLALMQWAKFTQ
ncbi:hypothetical protein [Xanthomonas sp. SI]|uniref:hypothetical protein n=1 Tax=Xanthomonas sp. SI TaxID=2724123 RepID=UPI00163B46AC|nr:hypothetical protein [Xanthomonas sp. SI]QNH14048.1 hypothetical protein HEP75_03516 [Xanthomonas sp. SI]